MLEVGTKAPDFELPDQNEEMHKLSDYAGKKVILYFYPKDNTAGCTKQACGFSERYPQFTEKGAVILGVSKDSIASHKKFEEKYGLAFTLLADPERKVIEAYDVWKEKKNYGKVSMGVVRTTYLINEQGVITGKAAPYSALTIVSTAAWGLGYFGMPHILLRFMAIEDEKKLKLSRRVATIWVVISLFVAVFIGVIGYTMSKVGALEMLTGSNSETIIVKISALLSQHGVIFALLAGVILAGILASTMSTSDSQLLAASSAVSSDILGAFRKDSSNKNGSMAAARITLLVISVVAAFIARNPDSSVFAIVSFAWAGFGAAFGPVVLFSLFWKRTSKWGALAGMVCGGSMVFIWKYLIRPLGGIWNIYELLPAFLIACAAIVIVSLLTPKPSKEIEEEFDRVAQMK